MSQTLADDSEVIFDQPEESAGAIEPEGSSRNRHRKETWLEGTEPHRGGATQDDGLRPTGRWGTGCHPRGKGGGGGRQIPCDGVRGYRVSDATRPGRITVGKPFSEDAEGNKTRAPGAAGGTYDDKSALV